MAQAIMHAREPLHGASGSAYVTIDGNRYLWMQLIDFEATFDKKKTEVGRLGSKQAGNRSGYGVGKFKAKAYYNTDIFRDVIMEYIKRGRDIYFDIQITNDDPNSTAGRHTTIFKDCNLDGLVLAKLDVNKETLDEDISGTFDDVEMPEKFNVLEGMR